MSSTTSESDRGPDAKRRPGRPKKLTPKQSKALRALALDNPTLSLPDLTRRFKDEHGVAITTGTVRKYLLAAGVKRSRPKPVKTAQPAALPPSTAPPRYTTDHRESGDEERYPHGLTDAEWELVRDIFETRGPGRPPRLDRRKMLDACIYVMRSGCPWRMLPKDFPAWNTVYTQFRRWSEAGLFEQMHDRLRAMWREREHRAVEPAGATLGAQSTRPPRKAASAGSTPARRSKDESGIS